MVWFWGSSPSGSKSDDATSNLDSSLREFLDKTTKATTSQEPQPEKQSYREQLGLTRPEESTERPSDNQSALPKESLYQDGRYAHLWKNYRPLERLEVEGKSDQERVSDIYHGQQNKALVLAKMANENCALEEVKWKQCLSTGSWTDQMTLCDTDKKRYLNCVEMQKKVLKALGYMAAMDQQGIPLTREMEQRERIQMHADRLYRRMLRRERARKSAEESGAPIPEFKPIILKTEGNTALNAGKSGEEIASLHTHSLDAEGQLDVSPPSQGFFNRIWGSATAVVSAPKPDLDHLDLSDIPEASRESFKAELGNEYYKGQIGPERLQFEKAAFKAALYEGRDLAQAHIEVREAERRARERRWEENRPSLEDRIRRITGRE